MIQYARSTQSHIVAVNDWVDFVNETAAKHKGATWYPAVIDQKRNVEIYSAVSLKIPASLIGKGTLPYRYVEFSHKNTAYILVPLAAPVALRDSSLTITDLQNVIMYDLIKRGLVTKYDYYCDKRDSWLAVDKVEQKK